MDSGELFANMGWSDLSESRTCLVALGANLPFKGRNKVETIRSAIDAIGSLADGAVRESGLYRTPAWPPGAGPDFVNAAMKITTDKAPDEIIRSLHAIERRLGRDRSHDDPNVRWAPRVIDLDLLAVDDVVLPDVATWHWWRDLPPSRQSEVAPDRLVLPHPRIQDRAFVLVPLCDVAPGWKHPVLELSAESMRDRCANHQLAEIELMEPSPA